jgi:BirA family biotin operon repressor/biotin-[acetyl-CoA-carboxylase] ligase
MEDLSAVAVPGFPGRLVCVAETDSTNRLALAISPQLADGDALVADTQSAGRGRLRRSRHTPRGGNLYLTFALRPALDPSIIPGLTLAAAIALADAVGRYVPEGVTIRWPNDLLIGGRKVAGILAQSAPEGSGRFIALGIGINVQTPRDGFPAELRTPATSVAAEAGREVPRAELLCGLLSRFASIRQEHSSSGLAPLISSRPSLFPFLGGPIIIDRDGVITEGTAVGIGRSGALMVRGDDGRLTELLAGEVVIRGPRKED